MSLSCRLLLASHDFENHLVGGARLASGVPTDAIEFYVTFSDDSYPEAYGYAKYRVHGFRYSGFVADE